ncbi:hypothetical protein [Dactylosporangium sp. NPDC000521]|uniref:hypothetical protein n=1 Tax=Dactylosporangium sp. NPDC000521 TaxID=3363975 RepID=UPI00367ACDB3
MTSLSMPVIGRPRRAGTAVLLVVVTLVLAWLTAGLLWVRGWSEPARGAALLLPPGVFTISTCVYLWWSQLRRRPVAFEVRDGAFVVPPADHLSAAFAASVLAASTVSAGILLFHRPDDPPVWPVAIWYPCLALTAALFLLRLLMRARGAGRMLLRPEGLLITYGYGVREIPWEAVAAGPPRTAQVIEPKLRIGRPDLVRTTGLARRGAVKAFLPTSESWVRREFLIDAINYYLAVPAARVSIGTPEGYEHLRRVLRA